MDDEDLSARPDYSRLDLFTPSMRQFVEVKNRYPSTLVLFRMGDFYETFFDDAIRANRLIGITLTKRGKLTDGTPIPMAGIPFVSLDTYISRLVKLGESVVIVEQASAPDPTGKTMIERRVARIVTPGTLTDTTLLPEKSDATLLAIDIPAKKDKNPVWGFTWLTLSSGDFRAELVTEEAFESTLARIRPSEVLVAEKHRSAFRELHPELVISSLPDWHFDAARGAESLKRHFKLATLDAWGVEAMPPILAAANALLDYTAETQVDLMPFIEPLRLVKASEFVVLDPATRRNLEIDQSLSPNGDGPTLFSVLDHCSTAMGSRELRRWLSQPLRSKSTAECRQDAIGSLLDASELLATLREILNALPDLERITTRTAMKSVRPRELAALRDALPAVAKLSALLRESDTPFFVTLGAEMDLPEEISEMLNAALVAEPSVLVREGGVIASSWNEELTELRTLQNNSGSVLLAMEERERAATGLTGLRVDFNKISGFFIEIPRAQAARAPAHYRRRQTLKNVERFITPELKALEDRVLSSKERALALEKRLYDEIVEKTAAHAEALSTAAHAIAKIDAIGAFALHAQEHHWVRPNLTERAGITIRRGRHPVVETTLESYVPNDCRLEDGRRMLIITGPNMGGKSTYMRSVALIVLLAWAGGWVPADAADIGPIDRIHTRIGASDDLARGRSTFMVEMTEAAAILSQATDYSLVLMDEIGRGTSTYDGLSLAASIAQELVTQTRSFTLFATHYFELTGLAQELAEAANVHVSATQNRSGVVFMHKITEGAASQSYGIAVAQLAGVPMPVVRRAKKFLARLETQAATSATTQPDLFGALPALDGVSAETTIGIPQKHSPEEEAARDDAAKLVLTLAKMDIDALSPRDALTRLYDLVHAATEITEKLEA